MIPNFCLASISQIHATAGYYSNERSLQPIVWDAKTENYLLRKITGSIIEKLFREIFSTSLIFPWVDGAWLKTTTTQQKDKIESMCQLPILSTKKRTCYCLLAKCFSVYFSGFCSIATENLINPHSMLFSCRSIFAIPILMINWHLIWHPIPLSLHCPEIFSVFS